MKRLLTILLVVIGCVGNMAAQRFFNLTADEVKIDSVLPSFSLQLPLGPQYADSIYEVSILYPEFMDMSQADVARYQSITPERPAALPQISQYVSVVRKQGVLNISFVPIVFREGKYQKLVSFMLDIKAAACSYSRKLNRKMFLICTFKRWKF